MAVDWAAFESELRIAQLGKLKINEYQSPWRVHSLGTGTK